MPLGRMVVIGMVVMMVAGCGDLMDDDLPDDLQLPPMPTDPSTTTLPPVTTTTFPPVTSTTLPA